MTSNRIFIGRKKELDRFKKDVFSPSRGYGYCYSLIGPNDIGKTTLISHLEEWFIHNKPKQSYYFKTKITNSTTYMSFWTDLIRKFSKEIPLRQLLESPEYDNYYIESIQQAYDYFNTSFYDARIESSFDSTAIVFLDGIFDWYTELGIRIIITIDEFDEAEKVFSNGDFFQRLFGYTEKGGNYYNLSIVTISRRNVSMIAHDMQDGSDFESAFPAYPLYGFSNEDLSEYFDTYDFLSSERLSNEIKAEILYLCGRCPKLLMEMRHEVELVSKECINIASIFLDRKRAFETPFRRMRALMESTFVDYNNNISCMDIFIQEFIGPVYLEEFEDKISNLYSYGFVTHIDKNDNDNIFTLSGIYDDDGNNYEIRYEPLSPYFVDYIRINVLQGNTRLLSSLIEEAEMCVRNAITIELKASYGSEWGAVVDKECPQKLKTSFINDLKITLLQNDGDRRNVEISRLNVMSFKDYITIINNHWDEMRKYFSYFKSIGELRDCFLKLYNCRNTSAHLNLHVYNEDTIKEYTNICRMIIKSISSILE